MKTGLIPFHCPALTFRCTLFVGFFYCCFFGKKILRYNWLLFSKFSHLSSQLATMINVSFKMLVLHYIMGVKLLHQLQLITDKLALFKSITLISFVIVIFYCATISQHQAFYINYQVKKIATQILDHWLQLTSN